MRTALRTALATALVAGVAITAPAFAAGAAFAADGPVAVPSAPAGPEAPSTGTDGAKKEAPKKETPKAEAPEGEAPKDETPKGEAPKTGDPKTEAPKTGDEKEQGAGTFVRNQILPNGAIAKIIRLDADHYRAEIYKQDQRVGTLEADGRPVAGNDDGTFLVLFETGLTSTWQGNYFPGARPGVYELANGSRVELAVVYGAHTLRTAGNGETRVLTTLNGTRQVVRYGKAVIVVEPDGGLAAYINGSVNQAAPRLVEPPATAPAPGPAVSTGECAVRQVVPSVFGVGWSVTLSNGLEHGPKAVLIDDQGKVRGIADRAHPFDSRVGLKIDRIGTSTPRLGQRTQGGDTPFRWSSFPSLPKGCVKEDSATSPAPSATQGTNVTTNNAGQTTVVPKGGVAAGAEPGTGGDSTALLAAGAGAASLAAAGLGFVVLRRRAAAARV
ncbi:hypothetical protein [Streptomyces sp. S1]|uniref:hypothetical protein n=1 Tax=Streptomyces sp. S1 TaxID=718288 RepID=UPI003D70AAB7